MIQIDEGRFENFLRVIYPNYDAMKQVVLQEIKLGKVIQNEDGTIQHNGECLLLAKYVDRKYLQRRYAKSDNSFACHGRIVRELVSI